MVVLRWFVPGRQFISPTVTYLGIAAISLGLALVVGCAYLFRQKNTTIKPFEESDYLIAEGPYQYSRNPIYLGMIFALIGVWLISGSLTPAIVIPLFAWLLQEKFIKKEEDMLAEKFGSQYQEYQEKVRRWL
jgi:protein-S-isoprenylcysteine O-methyltransferase Ste14